MAKLLLGPLLRYVGQTDATIWVETDTPCKVEALGCRSRTFHVEGHFYAVICVTGLEPRQTYPYTVTLDDEPVWPEPGSPFPPSVIRTLGPDGPVKLVFGSCRVTLPHEAPYTLTKDQDSRGREFDALYALALRLAGQAQADWPHTLLFLGDQIYADEVSPNTREFIQARRAAGKPPGEEVADFEEYTHLYLDAWSDPVLRWLLSTISTLMVFDDHDMHDDWNISESWVAQMRAQEWWDARIVGGFMSYWIYQHLGNLSPVELEADALLARVRQEEDAGPLLRRFAFRSDREVEGVRWSFARDLGTTRLVVLDARSGRVLEGKKRLMIDDREWDWLEAQTCGDFDHLLIATSVPFLLAPGIHYLEAWNEAICAGAWGERAAALGEKLRRAVDLEHWPAFQASFHRLAALLRAVAAGERGRAPASVVVLSGDVHHAYLAKISFQPGTPVQSAVYQAVCSPIRNSLDWKERRIFRFGWSGLARRLGEQLARSVGIGSPPLGWRLVHDEPWFDNQVATLQLLDHEAQCLIEKAVPEDPDRPRLDTVLNHRLA